MRHIWGLSSEWNNWALRCCRSEIRDI